MNQYDVLLNDLFFIKKRENLDIYIDGDWFDEINSICTYDIYAHAQIEENQFVDEVYKLGQEIAKRYWISIIKIDTNLELDDNKYRNAKIQIEVMP